MFNCRKQGASVTINKHNTFFLLQICEIGYILYDGVAAADDCGDYDNYDDDDDDDDIRVCARWKTGANTDACYRISSHACRHVHHRSRRRRHHAPYIKLLYTL